MWSDIKSLVVFIHDSLEDIGFHQIQQVIDFDALPDGEEFEAFLGDWLKQFSPEFAVSCRLLLEAVSSPGLLTSLTFFFSPCDLASDSSFTSSVLPSHRFWFQQSGNNQGFGLANMLHLLLLNNWFEQGQFSDPVGFCGKGYDQVTGCR